MRKFSHQAWLLMLVLWIGLGAAVHLTALDPVLAYVVGSVVAVGTSFVALAFWGFDSAW
jgi:hypothetical protein